MDAPRTTVTSQSGPPVRPGVQVMAVVAILLVLGLMFVLYGASSSSGAASGAIPSGTPLSSQTCSNLEAPNDLNTSLSGLYDGYSLQGYQAGPNGTPALGISSYPNLTAGQSALDNDWTAICEGGQFGYAYSQANGSSGFFSGGELAGDGHYVFFYGFNWQDACPASDPPSHYACQATATWTVDLVTDSVIGPSWTNLEETPDGAP